MPKLAAGSSNFCGAAAQPKPVSKRKPLKHHKRLLSSEVNWGSRTQSNATIVLTMDAMLAAWGSADSSVLTATLLGFSA